MANGVVMTNGVVMNDGGQWSDDGIKPILQTNLTPLAIRVVVCTI